MPRDKDFKRHVRRRMERTSERYTEARGRLRAFAIEWGLTGDQASAYVHRTDEDGTQVLRCAGDPGDGFGGLHGSLPAACYRGQRIRFSASLRAEDVSGRAGLWLRADGAAGESLAFGSTQDRPISGTTGWLPLAVVIEVPRDAERLALGAILRGRGIARLADPRVEPVSYSTPISWPHHERPGGWFLDGTGRDAYELVEDEDAMVLRSVATPTSFASMSRTAPARQRRGSRMRLSARLRGEAVEGMAGLWMRVDGGQPRRQLAFDNMMDRPLRGAFDWVHASVVLEVPEEADRILYGVLLSGPGVVRAEAIRLEPVDGSVQVTGISGGRSWGLGGSRPAAFELTFEPGERPEGQAVVVARLCCVADPGDGFGTMAQWLRLSDPPGRIRFHAALQGDCTRAVLWLRLNARRTEMLALVNQPDPPLAGAFDWTPIEAVLDVPAQTDAVGFGVALRGTGWVRVTDVALEGEYAAGQWTPMPDAHNLDFSE